ncbi:hypothetical protein Aab01nite_37790 [Paractinoplanes abujensis]|uniref:ANTAR domain-containing protein n=1 Tax=Paractinoplanes abujensis TaxID=882441 RepID=A0A7W7CX25_9ACTN|nr:GAF and ANTAR domain-containing protein [Actinoplanes abujensis]MBB4694596.1 hypothetical protein [Actinoplanes abujensis]GID20189.1 hypothetical protein Aab01nite_37790 [Actinoplanes abujensis]
MPPEQPPGDLAATFVTLNQHLSTDDPGHLLQRLVGLAVTAVPGCDWAAITVWPLTRKPRSMATSGPIAADVDQLQYQLGEGPCLTAAAVSDMIQISDVSTDDRWPDFARAVLSDTPVRGVLSFHLADQPDRTALNLYTSRPGAFDADAVTVAALFAAHARVLLLHATSAGRAAGLENALTASRQIGMAIGILMNIHKISSDDAFDLLRSSSQRLNRKLRDIADEVTETGTLPDIRNRGADPPTGSTGASLSDRR